jgi:DNA-binding NarL/FixJ family response regulator
VILYSAFADPAMTVPAIVAGADGIIHKGTATLALFDAIRRVARGRRALPPILPDLLAAAGAVLDERDLPIVAMLVDATSPEDIAQVLDVPQSELEARIDAILRRLRVPVGVGTL